MNTYAPEHGGHAEAHTQELIANQPVVVDAYLELGDDVRERYGLNGSIMAIVECDPGGRVEADRDRFIILDRGEKPRPTLDAEGILPLASHRRFVVLTDKFMQGRAFAEPTARPALAEGNGWRAYGPGRVQEFGRGTIGQELGKTPKPMTSRRHFSIDFGDNDIMITDLNSKNGTELTTGDKLPPEPTDELLRHTQPTEVIRGQYQEFRVGSTQYRYEGPAARGYLFRSVDAKGEQRQFLVYRSSSEGSLRVSQGIERDNKLRYLKGPEFTPYSQYTQDTQLHPEFERHYRQIAAADVRPTHSGRAAQYDATHAALTEQLLLTDEQVKRVDTDFERQVQYLPLGSDRLNTLLVEISSSSLNHRGMERAVHMSGKPEHMVWETYRAKVGEINNLLEREGLIPDFTAPPSAYLTDTHPILGAVQTEVFTKMVHGKTYEWHMSHDAEGRTWINRIRLQNAEPTAYGTDAQMVNSGVLTTKPVEYTSLATGLPSKFVYELTKTYSDISSFLNYLAPVQQYKRAYPARSRLFGYMS